MNKATQEKLLRIVRQNYEEIADDFNETRKKQLWPELINLTKEVRDGDAILDVGCGNGRLVSAFIGKKINYLGVDGSAKLIEVCEKKIEYDNFQFPISTAEAGPRRGGGNFQFKQGDILELDKVTREKFDWIFCVAVLHHLPGEDSRIKALSQMKNCLKPGGKIILTAWNLWQQKKFLKLILKFSAKKLIGLNKYDWGDIVFSWGADRSQRYYHAFNKRELKKLIAKVDLKIERLYKDKFNYYLILHS